MHLLIVGSILLNLAVDGAPIDSKKMIHKRGADEILLEEMFRELESVLSTLYHPVQTSHTMDLQTQTLSSSFNLQRPFEHGRSLEPWS